MPRLDCLRDLTGQKGLHCYSLLLLAAVSAAKLSCWHQEVQRSSPVTVQRSLVRLLTSKDFSLRQNRPETASRFKAKAATKI